MILQTNGNNHHNTKRPNAKEKYLPEILNQAKPTLPTTIGHELLVNPFMRCDQPAVIAAAKSISGQPELPSSAHVLGVIRAWKDRF